MFTRAFWWEKIINYLQNAVIGNEIGSIQPQAAQAYDLSGTTDITILNGLDTVCHKNNHKLLKMHSVKYIVSGVVFVPCRILVSFLCFLAALVALRYSDCALDNK